MEQSPSKAFHRMPIISVNIDDLATPGVLVEMVQDDADRLGAFRERALSFEDAFDATIELGVYVLRQRG